MGRFDEQVWGDSDERHQCFPNAVKPWGLLAVPAEAVVRDPQQTPYIDSSPDVLLSRVLRDDCSHEDVLPTLPG